ncbi:Cell wall protein IFF9, partial [Candida parapsilosis]
MRLLLRAQLVLWLLIATAWARNFQGGKTVDWGNQNVGTGDVHIFPGAIWSIINNAASDFHGNIQVDENGGLYVSAVSPSITLSATLYDSIYGFVNNGVVSFNAIKGASGYIFKIMGNKFENNGDLFFAASGQGSMESWIKAPDFHNNGFMHFYQVMKSDSYTYLGYDGKTMVNNGQICFTNQNWKQLTGMLGSGCVTAQGKSSFYFMNTNLQISEGEIFYLNGGETSIMAVGSTNNPQTFHVRGFGTDKNGVANKLGLTATLSTPTPGKNPWAYNARDGILTLYVGLYTQNFEIGTGYDFTKFQIVSDTSRGLPGIYNGAVQYNGPPPNPGMPPECKPCKPIPGIPGVDPDPTTSSIRTLPETTKDATTNTPADSLSYESTTTVTDMTTSTHTTVVTTTWLVTNSDGSVETETGIATPSDTNSYESTTTVTDMTTRDSSSTITTFETSSDTNSYDSTTTVTDTTTTTETTVFTTTWIVTKSDGSVETETGVITQSGDSSSTVTTFETPSETGGSSTISGPSETDTESGSVTGTGSITDSSSSGGVESTDNGFEPTGEPTGEPSGSGSESTGEPTGEP